MKQGDFTGSCKQRANYAMWTDFSVDVELKILNANGFKKSGETRLALGLKRQINTKFVFKIVWKLSI